MKPFLKTLWEKEKMLVTSIFSFSHNVFLPFPKTNSIFHSHFLSSANALNLDQSKILSFGKELSLLYSLNFTSSQNDSIVDWPKFKTSADDRLTFFQTTNCRLFQTERLCRRNYERVCRRQFRIGWKW